MELPWLKRSEISGGTKARQEAEETLRTTKERRQEVRRLSESLQGLRVRNHFGEGLVAMIEKGRDI